MEKEDPPINNPIDEIWNDIKSLPKYWFSLPRKYRVIVSTLLYVFVGMVIVAAVKVSMQASDGTNFLIVLITGLIIEGLVMPKICSTIIGKEK